MIDNLLIKASMLKYNIFTKAREKKRVEEFLSSSPEVNKLIRDLKKDEVFHLLLHSHYDPAWFARRSVTRKMLSSFYKKVMHLLDIYPDYKFTADSQTQLVEDLLANVGTEERDSVRNRLVRYISEGRLIVGPYYAGIDLNLSSGVVLRRNLLYGIRDARRLGWEGKHVGWMIDQFGFPAQMWQLHKKFGIEGIILWRGLGLKPDEASTEIVLESPDGSKILGKWLFVQGYRFGLYVGKYSDIGVPRLIQESKKIEKYTKSKNLLIMDGYEGESAPDNPMEVIEKLRAIGGKVRISTPRIFVSELLKELDLDSLPIVRGYQNYGYYSPVLKGVISARQYIKQAHQLCDDTLSKLVEPISILAERLGIDQDWRDIEDLWRKLIRMASHDEIGGCGIDDIHRDSFEIYKGIYSKAISIVEQNLFHIGSRVDLENHDSIPFIVFNSLPFDREDIVRLALNIPAEWPDIRVFDDRGLNYKTQICKTENTHDGRKRVELLVFMDNTNGLPALGYKLFFVKGADNRKGAEERKSLVREGKEERKVICGENWMENNFLRVVINKNGTFDIEYKKTGREYRNLGYLRVEPDKGDTYDFSHIENHRVITSLGESANVERMFCGELMARFRIGYRLMVPSRISENRKEWVSEKIPLVITLELGIRENSNRVDLDLYVNNSLKDSRIRVCFPVETETKSVFVNRQFDVYEMPIDNDDLSIKEKEEIFRRMNGMISSGMDVVEVKTAINFKWIDMPVSINPKGEIVESLGLINRANFEFEISEENNSKKIVEFTLLRSVGWNARADLLTRNINAGWEIYTPDAYCHGSYFFPLSILPHEGDWKVGRLNEEADKRMVPPVGFELSRKSAAGEKTVTRGVLNSNENRVKNSVHLPSNFSLFSVITDSVVVSEITTDTESAGKIVLVLYNPDKEASKAVFRFSADIKSVNVANLVGEINRSLEVKNRVFEIVLDRKEISQLIIELKNGKVTTRKSGDKTNLTSQSLFSRSLEKTLRLEMKPRVDKYEVEFERERWLKCRRLYRKRLLEWGKTSVEKLTLEKLIERFRGEEELINLENTVKEAHYSYLLTLKRYYETLGKERATSRVDKSIAKMGRELINLRVKKREAEIYKVFFENLKTLGS